MASNTRELRVNKCGGWMLVFRRFLNAQGYYGRLCTELQFVFSGGRRLPPRLGFGSKLFG